VIVTAEKRSEDLQHTPVAVTTLTEADLTQAGADDVQNLQKLLPDVRVQRWEGAELVSIRGVAGGDTSPTGEQPTSVFIDGGYLTKAQALQGQLYDIAHIEVLKGPQGTLYGRNATGGAVNFLTNQPTQTFGGNGEIEAGNYDLLRTEGAINLPLASTFAVRFAFQTYTHSGYQDSGFADADEKSGRLTALWKPTSTDTVMLQFDSTRVGGVYPGMLQVVAVAPGKTGVVPPNPQDDTAAPPNGYGEAIGHYETDEENWGGNIRWDHDSGWATSTVQVTGRVSNANDWNPGTNPVGEDDHVPAYFRDETIEARLASNATTPFQWVVGLFQLGEYDTGYNAQYSSSTNVSNSGLGLTFANPDLEARSYALFGQTTYTPTLLNSLHIIFGARETWDHKTGEAYTLDGPQGPGCPCYLVGGAPFFGTLNYHAFNYKAGLSYDLAPTSMLYADVATGYKAGGIGYGATPVYQPEYITAYEGGLKNRLLDDRLQVNIEAFLYRYRNYEETLAFFIPALQSVYASTVNAGRATYRGLTTDVQYLITKSDRIAWSGIWSTGYYGENNLGPLVPPQYVAVAGSQNLSNSPILEIAKYAGTVSYDHTWPALNGSLDGQLAMQYRGRTDLADANVNTPGEWIYSQAPWAMWDVSLRYDSSGEHPYYVTAYVHNIGNELRVNYGQGTGNSTYITGAYLPPRTYGAMIGVKF
jgi:iron complex outermembrane receptor protein